MDVVHGACLSSIFYKSDGKLSSTPNSVIQSGFVIMLPFKSIKCFISGMSFCHSVHDISVFFSLTHIRICMLLLLLIHVPRSDDVQSRRRKSINGRNDEMLIVELDLSSRRFVNLICATHITHRLTMGNC